MNSQWTRLAPMLVRPSATSASYSFSCICGEFIGDLSPNVSMGLVGNDAGLFWATEEKMAETPRVQVVQDLGWKEAL